VAQQVLVKLVDDVDGSTADETVELALDGKSYELDLSNANAGRLRDALAPYVAAARRAGGARRASAPPQQSSGTGRSREETQEIREWLRSNGYTVSDRGRIRADQLAAWESKSPAPTPDGSSTTSPDADQAPKAKRGKKAGSDDNVASVQFSDANAS
jgi:hypothetical protein